jgi:hypothetical protein
MAASVVLRALNLVYVPLAAGAAEWIQDRVAVWAVIQPVVAVLEGHPADLEMAAVAAIADIICSLFLSLSLPQIASYDNPGRLSYVRPFPPLGLGNTTRRPKLTILR